MQFHWYGLIVGLAAIIGYLVAEKKAVSAGIDDVFFGKTVIWIGLGALFGARLWHVLTDWGLYSNNLLDILFIWSGGMSIIGAILGGIIVLPIVLYLTKKQKYLGIYLDSFAFSLPLAQAVGRFANWVNQELYGLPTNLPWAIYIKPENRPYFYQENGYFHPLFFYEIIWVLVCLLVLNVLLKNKKAKFGSGKFFSFYLFFYGLGRFCLDFMRIDRGSIWFGVGFNQLTILIFLPVLLYIGLHKDEEKNNY